MERPMFRSSFHKYRKIFRAIFARIILAGHGWFAVWVTGGIDSKYYGIFVVSIPLFLLETVLIIYFRGGCELKRFCTSFMCYLLTIVPALWIQRQNIIERSMNETDSAAKGKMMNLLDVEPNLESTYPEESGGCKIFDLLQREGMTPLLEQSMMFIIILCRWFLPRGRIDRNSLSQLLLMYSAISADILDFSEIFNEKTLKEDETFRNIILSVWSWSLLQFTLVVTTSFTLHRRRRHQGELVGTDQNSDSDDKSETLSILMVFFMQDGPFLMARCYAIFKKEICTYNIFFFSLKNLLTVVLGMYRLLVLCGCVSKEGDDLLTMAEVAKSKESLDMIDFDTPKSKKQRKIKNRKLAKSKDSFDVESEGVSNGKGKKDDKVRLEKCRKY